MTTFVTGGLGFIGSNFVISHLKRYPLDEIVILDNNSYAANPDNLKVLGRDWRVSLINVDIRDLKNLGEYYKFYEPDITFHFAAESHVDNSIRGDDDFLSTNIGGTHNILKCVRKYGGRLVHVSTDEVFGSLPLNGVAGDSFTETTPYNPRNPYSASKAASDHLVLSYVNTHNIEAVVTNCSNNYGPRQHSEKFIPTVIRHIKNGQKIPVYGTGENVRDWLFVDDHCDALMAIGRGMGKCIGQRFNIGGGVEISNLEMIREILAAMGKSTDNYIENWVDFVSDRKGHDLRYSINSSKLQKTFGWKPRTNLQEGLVKTLEWYHA